MDIKDRFITRDTAEGNREVTFSLIEDEDGGTYWAYGHVPSDIMGAELDRWMEHTMGPGYEEVGDIPVEHLWGQFDDEDDERFTLVHRNRTPEDTLSDAEVMAKVNAFPVTRVRL